MVGKARRARRVRMGWVVRRSSIVGGLFIYIYIYGTSNLQTND